MLVAMMSEEQRKFSTKLSENVVSDSDSAQSNTSQASEDDSTKENRKFIDHVFTSSDPINKRLVNRYF